jgi:hypothetical protein
MPVSNGRSASLLSRCAGWLVALQAHRDRQGLRERMVLMDWMEQMVLMEPQDRQALLDLRELMGQTEQTEQTALLVLPALRVRMA